MTYLDINPNIQKLAEELFDSTEWDEIQQIAKSICRSKKQRLLSIRRLKYIVPTRPKRPLYYLNYELKFLPRSSRFVVENMGSYLDLLVKELRFEIEGKYYKKSLGTNLVSLMKRADNNLGPLLEKLQLFNRVAYVPAKHEYGPPNDPRHYFSCSDAVIVILSAVKLGEELKMRSKFVRNLCQDLVLPAQMPLIGNHPRTDTDGIPFDFKERLVESRILE